MLFGTLITNFLLVPLNAFFPMDFDVNFFDLIIMVFKFLSPLNALLPMVFREIDFIVTLFSFVHFLNALFPIDVTFLPMVTFVSFLLLAKALEAMY